tara:strand:+ start:472 stop:684 length:213 start_codon:yes stop_codon:yes gene_type:complete
MKGKIVEYRGWKKEGPKALVIDSIHEDSDYHHRIRVMWLGDKIPIQAQALSVRKSKISTWVNPKNFIIVD